MKQYPDGWTWQPDKCPCDEHFIKWVHNSYLSERTILHMGTGLHHRVGAFLCSNHYVLGLTLSTQEIDSYVIWLNENTLWADKYKVLFTDIHALPLPFLPAQLDIVTLFHLGEITPATMSARRACVSVINTMLEQLSPMGVILGYTGSVAAQIAIPLMDELLEFKAEYKSLRIYAQR